MRRWSILLAMFVCTPAFAQRGDFCNKDSDCAWDDACNPARCVAAKAAKNASCEKARPPAGTCGCNEDMCTLRPTDAATVPSTGTCKRDDECAVDVAAGTCQAGGEALIGPIRAEGPVCTCDEPAARCKLEWSGPVACKTWRDCSWVHKPRLRPVPSKSVKRPVRRPVRPCKDAEVDSVCEGGQCRIVGWSC